MGLVSIRGSYLWPFCTPQVMGAEVGVHSRSISCLGLILILFHACELPPQVWVPVCLSVL